MIATIDLQVHFRNAKLRGTRLIELEDMPAEGGRILVTMNQSIVPVSKVLGSARHVLVHSDIYVDEVLTPQDIRIQVGVLLDSGWEYVSTREVIL